MVFKVENPRHAKSAKATAHEKRVTTNDTTSLRFERDDDDDDDDGVMCAPKNDALLRTFQAPSAERLVVSSSFF
jgi:hypothetical protein